MLRIDAQRFAEQELRKYGLDAQWRFEINERSKRLLGCCYYLRKLITATGWYVDMNPPVLIHDTILHEIAHALAGPHADHGPKWVEQCIRVGANPKRLTDSASINKPASKFTAVCSECNNRYNRNNNPRTRSYYCHCSRGQEQRAPLRWQVNDEHYTMAQYGPSKAMAAQEIVVARPDDAVDSLLTELRLSVDTERNKKIRAKLRRLNHKGGLR